MQHIILFVELFNYDYRLKLLANNIFRNLECNLIFNWLFGVFTFFWHQDVYLHTNCLATLANMAPHVHRLSAYASQRLVSLFDMLSRKYVSSYWFFCPSHLVIC